MFAEDSRTFTTSLRASRTLVIYANLIIDNASNERIDASYGRSGELISETDIAPQISGHPVYDCNDGQHFVALSVGRENLSGARARYTRKIAASANANRVFAITLITEVESMLNKSMCTARTATRLYVLCGLCLSALGCVPGEQQTAPLSSELQALARQGSILELQTAMESGQLSARSLSEYFLEQIELQSELNTIISLSPNALDVADELDAERASGDLRGPLHGIPLLIKDNIETLDLPTTAGSLALADNRTRRDATVVARLRSAGVVILGKTNLSEWANFRSTRSSSGWSAIGGQTRNPHDHDRSPCGSSSGSGAAVAAGLAVAALGTETAGSVVFPASVSGVVGIKPTVGLVSRFGIVPISHTQDTAGPMARTVSDAALLLSAMAGLDANDAATQAAQTQFGQDYADGLSDAALQGTRIGVVRSATGYHEGVDALFETAIADLQRGGAVIVDDLRFEPYSTFGRDALDVLLFEFKHNLNAYFADLPNDLNGLTLESLIQFNRAHADQEMLYFQQELFEQSQAKGPLTSQEYTGALARIQQETRSDGIDRLLEEHDLDVLIAPTLGPAWSIDLVTGDRFLGGFAGYPARSAYPHVTLPMGKVHGLPVGLSFTASRFEEAAVLSAAHGFERISNRGFGD